MAEPRYKNLNDVIAAWEKCGYEKYSVEKDTFFLSKKVSNIDDEEREIADNVVVKVSEMYSRDVTTEIKFPTVKRKGKSITKRVSYDYKKTPEGLVLRRLESNDNKLVLYDGKIVLLASLK